MFFIILSYFNSIIDVDDVIKSTNFSKYLLVSLMQIIFQDANVAKYLLPTPSLAVKGGDTDALLRLSVVENAAMDPYPRPFPRRQGKGANARLSGSPSSPAGRD